MQVYLSVVSHNHGDLIQELACLEKLASTFNVVLKSNTGSDGLGDYCQNHSIHYLNNSYGLGFGHNNNLIYEYCRSSLGMKDSDLFIVLNPDVLISKGALEEVVAQAKKDAFNLCAINLFRDENFETYDPSVRQFPGFVVLTASLLGFNRSYVVDKSTIAEPQNVDWAAGSFMAFKAGHFDKLGGFDERYYMYCEDVDICYRSMKMGSPVIYYPSIKAVHFAKHENRKVFSRHFYWHVKSALRFLLSKQLNA